MKRMRVITDYNVASNPVARAIARKRVTTALLRTKLRVFMMNRFEDCREVVHDASWVLALIACAAELDPQFGRGHPKVRVVRGAMSALTTLSKTYKWDPDQAVAIETALVIAEELNPKIDKKYVFDAWKEINK